MHTHLHPPFELFGPSTALGPGSGVSDRKAGSVTIIEIAGLRLEDLDWNRGVARFIQLKNRRLLHLPLSWSLVKALADYLKNERPRPSPYRHVFRG